ncbi:MAG: hypothetical protein KAW91_00170 [candidate division Zixibacteria bacterium]|nr:hypothetical protein [candidate division Zixibacteria bacterium]MCK4606279.1 hypothetical protein [candidate division Zixibacteria bacterium]
MSILTFSTEYVGFRWLRFALFGKNMMTVRDVVLNTKRAELKAKRKIK